MVETELAGLEQAITQITRELARQPSAEGMSYYYELAGRSLDPGYLREAKAQGKKVVGTFCTLVPEELVLAAGAVPVRLCSGFGATITRTEGTCPASLCPLVKSSYGLWLSTPPIAAQCDVVAVPTTCDAKKKLAELLSDRVPVWLVQVPSTKESTEARRAWGRQIVLLKQQLENLTGRRIGRKALRTAIAICNQKRAALRRLYELRKEARIWGRDALLVADTSFHDDPVQWTRQTDALCAEIAQRDNVQQAAANLPRLLLTGSPVVFPTWKLPMLVEESGGIIVADDICTGAKALWDPAYVTESSLAGMLEAIGERALSITCPCFAPSTARLNRLVQLSRDFRVDGILYHVLRGCHLYGMEAQAAEDRFRELALPTLRVETDYSLEDTEQLRTRVEAFVEMLSARKLE